MSTGHQLISAAEVTADQIAALRSKLFVGGPEENKVHDNSGLDTAGGGCAALRGAHHRENHGLFGL